MNLVKYYKERPSIPIEAVKWDPLDWPVFSADFEPIIKLVDDKYYLVELGFECPLESGYFIVKNPDGNYEAYTKTVFYDIYELA